MTEQTRRITAAVIATIMVTVGIILLLAGLTEIANAQGLPPDQHHAAQVAAGESPVALMGEAGYVNVLCTMQNRVRDPRFPNTLAAVVTQGYFAPPRTLTAREGELAAAVLSGRTGCEGYRYVLSGPDVKRLGLPDGERVVEGKGGLVLHFYTGWPQ